MEVHHKHGPIRNWREFAIEIGVIVTGIAIALGGEQAIETIHHRNEVREVRESLRKEMANNMGVMQDMIDKIPCSTERLDEIERWANSLQTAHLLHLVRPADIPPYTIFPTATWHAAPPDALARLPLEERNSFALWYDGVNDAKETRKTVIDNWGDIRRLSRASRLSEEQRLKLFSDIDTIRNGFRYMNIVYKNFWTPLAKEYGVTVQKVNPPKELLPAKAAICQPLLAS